MKKETFRDGGLYIAGLLLVMLGIGGIGTGFASSQALWTAAGFAMFISGTYIVDRMRKKYPSQEKPRRSAFDLSRNEKIFAAGATVVIAAMFLYLWVLLG